MRFRKLVVVGVGLIGGSVALALKRHDAVGEVVGVGRSARNLEDALGAGVIDRAVSAHGPWTAELADADVVLLAAPVGEFDALFAAMAPALGPDAVITDGGSTKQDAVAAARRHLGSALPRYVPAHPIAGTEHSGAKAAFASLYEGRNCILTPLPVTAAEALARVGALWARCGARLVTLTPERHDAVFAAVSHLPHFLAAAYVASLAERPDAGELLALAGTGFRDFTRIAAASPVMWRDIALANRGALLDEIGVFRAALGRIEAAVRAGDAEGLERLLGVAAAARRHWAAGRGEG